MNDIEEQIIKFFRNKTDYKDYITKKNQVEKRKFLTFLLIITTSITLSELSYLTVGNFIKLKEGRIINTNKDKYCSFSFNIISLNLNKEDQLLFIEELYGSVIGLKTDDDILLSSIINQKPLAKHNLRKDFNEIFTELLLTENTKYRLRN